MSRMTMTSFWALISALKVHPSKTQFFHYEQLSLSCGEEETSSEWTCRRNTTSHTNQACCRNTTRNTTRTCSIRTLYQTDSGVYWCESVGGKDNGRVNITVTRLPVILESPAVPVTEGDSVTLRCRSEDTSTFSSGITADFYKDNILLCSSSSTNITLHRVSKADEGLYKCNISDKGESLESWLIVRGHPVQLEGRLARILLPVVSAGVALLVLMLLSFLRRQRGPGGSDGSDLPYTDVIVSQEVEPTNRIRGTNTERTFYSAVKPGSS